MKKIATFLTVTAIAAITLVSCSKKGDYTCTCTFTDASGAVIGQATSSKLVNVKKSDAEKSCNVTSTTAGLTSTCKLDD